MDSESQIGHHKEIISRPLVLARLDPTKDEFKAAIENKPMVSFLDLGVGYSPRISVDLNENDLWVGCDPSIDKEGEQIVLHSRSIIHPNSKRFIYSCKAHDVPEFKPDFIMAIAPNPVDVKNDHIINYDLEKFLDPNKTQFFMVIFETHTDQSKEFGQAARIHTRRWTNAHNFVRIENSTNPLRESFKPNSVDLGTYGNKLRIYMRRPQK